MLVDNVEENLFVATQILGNRRKALDCMCKFITQKEQPDFDEFLFISEAYISGENELDHLQKVSTAEADKKQKYDEVDKQILEYYRHLRCRSIRSDSF